MVQISFEGKYNIGFGIPIEFPSQRKKNYWNRSIIKEIGFLWSRFHLRESTISELESPSNFLVREKKIIEIGPETTKLCFNLKKERKLVSCGPDFIWGKVQYRIWNPHQISKSKKKKLFKSVQKQRNYALIKNAKIVMFKMDVRTFQYWL